MEALTVGQLIDALSKYPRDERVLIEHGDWWRQVDRVEGPTVASDGTIDRDESDEYSLPTIMVGDEFDSRSI